MQETTFAENTKQITLSFRDSLTDLYNSIVMVLPELFISLLLLLVFVYVAGKLSLLVQNRLGRRVDDPLLVTFISNIVKYGLIMIGLMVMLQLVGLTGIASGLLAGAGLSAFVVGFALKDIAENFLAGIILAFNRPFSIDDTVKVRDFHGKILTLNLRSTQMKTFDGKDIYIPNSILLKEVVTNFTRDGLLRIEFIVNVGLQHDFEDVKKIIISNIEHLEGVLHEEKPAVVIEDFTATAMNLRVLIWVNTYDYKMTTLVLKTKAMDCVKKALQKHGILQTPK
ncbi:mechanosensitive ion channel family protein [uncultured Pontibacter sp.]|uniref:mechanosensitive ion channel family protein n=1 Tax=uncultured Pontibacter sp. TaxID=453356 RepID=UPI00262CB6AA|nr:mechanosensitive ion channel family protein [uncultured Pontibacter sp.]